MKSSDPEAAARKSAYQLVSAYRAFALAIAALQMVLLIPQSMAEVSGYLILGVIGLYSLARVLLPLNRRYREGYPGLGIDIIICISLLFLTGGLSSPFVLYSFSPVISAALIFPRIVALGYASLGSLSLVTSHLLYAAIPFRLMPVTSQFNFGLIGVYIISSFIIATIPYTANINIYRQVRLDATLSERKRLARQLHDTVAQTLSYINLKANMVKDMLAKGDLERGLQELGQMKESLDSTYEEVRETINTLGRPLLEKVEFVPALSRKVKEFHRESNIKSHLSLSGRELTLSSQAADELLHIVGEAMTNARNHAQATALEVKLNCDSERVELKIKDNGRGFDPSAYQHSQKTQNHHGIAMMRERAESLGGKLAIISSSSRGTEIKVTIPLEI